MWAVFLFLYLFWRCFVMAAAVDYSKLLTHELKAQTHARVTEIGNARARELQAGKPAVNESERSLLKLFEAMEKRGLGGACFPSEQRVRVQQQQRRDMFLPPTVPYPVRVPLLSSGRY